MNTIFKILHALATKNWPIALRVFLIGLLCAAIYPVITVITGLDGTAWSPFVVKIILALGCVAGGLILLWKYAWKWSVLPQWSRCAIPIACIATIMLICGAIPPLRSLGVALGLVASSVGLLVIAIYVFSARLLYAAFIEAPSSADVDLADAEIPAKEVFRTILAILAWEWFGAWYLTTFSSEITMATGIFAFFSLGIVVLTSYSLGYKGETGRKVLMYSALTAFILLSFILLDRMILGGMDMHGNITFLTSGYIGGKLKAQGISTSQIGVVGWIAILVFLDLAGVAIAWATEKPLISKLTFAIIATLSVYLAGSWITLKGFSMKKSIETLTAFLSDDVRGLSHDITIALTLGAIVGGIACIAGAITAIRRENFPAWSMAGLSIALFVLYQLVFI